MKKIKLGQILYGVAAHINGRKGYYSREERG
jgi:hypothetical protein